jgi:CRISPR system Cascade subunit CasA
MGANHFDLLTEPWIDVQWAAPDQGYPARIGLRDLFVHADQVTGFHAPFAPAASGLMRVLAVVTAQITGLDQPMSADAWHERRWDLLDRQETGFDLAAIDRVLGDTTAFHLFGPRPFLQDPRLVDQCPKRAGVGKLGWGRAAGNNPVFLSHEHQDEPRPIPVHEAPWHLLAWMYYGPSGRCSTRTVGTANAADSSAGPLRRVLSVHPWGANLYETLLLNLAYSPIAAKSQVQGPLWECDLHDPSTTPPTGAGVGWQLANRFQHSLLLMPDEDGSNVVDAYITWAWRSKHPRADDPYVAYLFNKEGEPYPVYSVADRAIWRDLDALILKQRADSRHSRRPAVLEGLALLPFEAMPLLERLRIRAFGYDQEGKVNDYMYFQANTPPVLSALLDTEFQNRVRAAHTDGATVGENLRYRLDAAWRDLVGPPKNMPPWSGSAMAEYWTEAEARFWEMILDDGPLPPLPNTYIRMAARAFETATDAYARSPRAIRILESHRSRLFHGWKKETS